MERETSLTEFLLQHADSHPVSFHMPGHKGSEFYKKFGYSEFLNKIMDCDITEIPGADSLHQTEGIIKEVQDKYGDLYDVSHSYLLVNSSSGGVIASVLATVPIGGQLIMARNCHKSVFNSLIMGEIQPVYAYPELISEYGILGEISSAEIERCIQANPEASAVILPSPNYYGICSDISAIAELVHKNGKVLIVDQAHGAHLKFFDPDTNMPPAAENSGADIVINSTHKTLASFTQSAILNLNSDRVDRYLLEDKLQSIQTTSPSYLLMASLDINASILKLHGETLMSEWAENLDHFYREADKIHLSNGCNLTLIKDIKDFDRSKINIDTYNLGMTAAELEAKLIRHNIFPELTTGNILMLMTGIGNRSQDYENLLTALKEIIAHDVRSDTCSTKRRDKSLVDYSSLPKQVRLYPIPKKQKRVPLAEAQGLICASSIIPYPPGIPLICPGEMIQTDAIDHIKALRDSGEKVLGINERDEIAVGI